MSRITGSRGCCTPSTFLIAGTVEGRMDRPAVGLLVGSPGDASVPPDHLLNGLLDSLLDHSVNLLTDNLLDSGIDNLLDRLALADSLDLDSFGDHLSHLLGSDDGRDLGLLNTADLLDDRGDH